jgi:hypothetical protein
MGQSSINKLSWLKSDPMLLSMLQSVFMMWSVPSTKSCKSYGTFSRLHGTQIGGLDNSGSCFTQLPYAFSTTWSNSSSFSEATRGLKFLHISNLLVAILAQLLCLSLEFQSQVFLCLTLEIEEFYLIIFGYLFGLRALPLLRDHQCHEHT